MRITTFSPSMIGKVDTPQRHRLGANRKLNRPSCGTPVLVDLELDKILIAAHHRGQNRLGQGHRLAQHAVDAVAHLHDALARLNCECPRPAILPRYSKITFTVLAIGASSAKSLADTFFLDLRIIG
jgi:hypothetical protein